MDWRDSRHPLAIRYNELGNRLLDVDDMHVPSAALRGSINWRLWSEVFPDRPVPGGDGFKDV
jgi:hypothetical protein